MNKRREKLTPEVIFVLLSLVLHGLFCAVLYLNQTPARFEPPERVEISYEPFEKPHAIQPARQIVDQKNRVNDEKDEKAKYLSAFDQKVIKETRAKNSGKFNNTVAGGAKTTGQREAKDAEKQKKRPSLAKGDLPSLKDLSPAFTPTPGASGQPAPVAGEAPQTDDYLKDLQKGMQTMLTTREFVYFSYYSRIKQQISQYWEPNVREKVKIIYRTGRSIASSHDRVTRLLIVLDKRGNLMRVEVLSRSGVIDLDDAAVEAFRSAAPFPNPPRGMVEKDGTIKIRWDFVLEA